MDIILKKIRSFLLVFKKYFPLKCFLADILNQRDCAIFNWSKLFVTNCFKYGRPGNTHQIFMFRVVDIINYYTKIMP